MVRIAGQTPTMDNREELLDALNDFSRKQPKEIPPLLEQFLKQVAKTGETLFPWTLLKPLFVAKLEQVMAEFGQEFAREQLPPCPNVENARFEVYKSRIMEAVHRFNGAPFTIQRLCELLTEPRRHYKRCDKFMRGLEKNVLVVSTVDPFGRKVVSESKNLMNGMDSSNSPEDSPPTTASSNSATPPVPSWTTSSPTTVWPTNADAIITSTSPLLEVSDLPDPKEAATDAAATTSTPATTSTSQESPAQVNGHHSVSSSIEVRTESDPATVTSGDSAPRPETVASSVVTPVTSMAEAVDSSDQLVAAEEMVGVEEDGEAATTSTEIPQQTAPGVVEETVVEVPPAEEVSRAAAEPTESSGETTSTGSGDWISNATDSKETVASSTPAGPQESSDTSSTDTVTPDTSTVSASTDSDTSNSKQDTSSTEAEAVSRDKKEDEEDTVKTSEGEGVSATEEDAGSAAKTVSSTHSEESVSDSSTSHAEVTDSESVPASSESSSSSSSNASTAISDSTSTQPPSSIADTTTTATTSASTPVDEVTSKDDQAEASTAAEAQAVESMETDSGESSSNTSQAAESSEPCPAVSDSDVKDAPQGESDNSNSTAAAEPMEHD